MNYFINNREFIKNLAINTGTSETPVFTTICTTSEINIDVDLETKDFYVFCDAGYIPFYCSKFLSNKWYDVCCCQLVSSDGYHFSIGTHDILPL